MTVAQGVNGKAGLLKGDSQLLVKSYSKMTEEERKELIKKAFEAKKQLQEELRQTKEQMAEKDKELKKLQDQVRFLEKNRKRSFLPHVSNAFKLSDHLFCVQKF